MEKFTVPWDGSLVAVLFFFLTVVPLTELYVLFAVGEKVGFLPTVGLTIFTAALGTTLARVQARRVWADWKRALSTLQSPEHSVLEGLMILVGGVLLLTPGFLTDGLGFLLLLPWPRRALLPWIKARTASYFERVRVGTRGSSRVVFQSSFVQSPRDNDVVETTAEDVTREESRLPERSGR